MKLDIQQSLPCSPARFWEMYWSETFEQMVSEGATFSTTLLEEKREGPLQVQLLRFEPHEELPRAVASIIGTSKLIYDQEERYDAAAGTIDFRLIPSFLPDKLSASGQMRVEPASAGCTLRVSGEVRVAVRFIGGKVEQAVVREVASSYERMASTARRWLAEHGTTS